MDRITYGVIDLDTNNLIIEDMDKRAAVLMVGKLNRKFNKRKVGVIKITTTIEIEED